MRRTGLGRSPPTSSETVVTTPPSKLPVGEWRGSGRPTFSETWPRRSEWCSGSPETADANRGACPVSCPHKLRAGSCLVVGLTIDKRTATERFGDALALARSNDPLPDEWLERTRSVSRARNKTFTPALGTALLAKATDDAVDALSLREDESHKGYSARSLAKEVLVPCCVRAGIDIRNKGGEPLNNQPFLRAARIGTHLKVKANAVEELKYLVESIERADFLRGRDALMALAAFLRARIEASELGTPIALGPGVLELAQLVAVLDKFLSGDPEGGKVGQAMATAVLDLVFADVKTKKINDPSSKWPGDVGAFDRGTQVLSGEVKQRPMTDAEILLFAQRLQAAEVHRGLIMAFGQGKEPLDDERLRYRAHRLCGVDLAFYCSAGSMLREAVLFAPQDTPLSLAKFPRCALVRMAELEVSSPRMQEWAALFAAPTPSAIGT